MCPVSVGVFPSAWYDNVREIACKSPLLLSMGAEQYLDKELELNHPLKIDNIAPVCIYVCLHMHSRPPMHPDVHTDMLTALMHVYTA